MNRVLCFCVHLQTHGYKTNTFLCGSYFIISSAYGTQGNTLIRADMSRTLKLILCWFWLIKGRKIMSVRAGEHCRFQYGHKTNEPADQGETGEKNLVEWRTIKWIINEQQWIIKSTQLQGLCFFSVIQPHSYKADPANLLRGHFLISQADDYQRTK